MQWDKDGNKHFSNSLEAVMSLRTWTRSVVRWLHECQDRGAVLFTFPQYRSLLNDISNVSQRWIMQQEEQITGLQERVRDLETARCPHCGKRRGDEPAGAGG